MEQDEPHCVLCLYYLLKGQYALCLVCKRPCCHDCIPKKDIALCCERCMEIYKKKSDKMAAS